MGEAIASHSFGSELTNLFTTQMELWLHETCLVVGRMQPDEGVLAFDHPFLLPPDTDVTCAKLTGCWLQVIPYQHQAITYCP